MGSRISIAITGIFLLALVASTASALTLDARIGGIFEDALMTTPVVGVTVSPDGNVYGHQAASGEFVLLTIDVANPEGDFIQTLFATMIFQGDKVESLGGNIPSAILQEPGFGGNALANINSGDIKGNSPNLPGQAGDVWMQAVSYASLGGSTATGPDTISLLFQVTGVSVSTALEFDMGLTQGDSITFPSSTTFSGALITPMPEPTTAILIGLGLTGLAASGRGRNRLVSKEA